ncbi:hypothetical protein GFH30_06265 [Acinetobacter wanghuae]|uniref:DUF2829 domain-containing protein n=1 Tax=Acinetobacter wanghuae TaxID=2662362 RepID=A0ABX6CZN7_9GAMM|nr:hypothetical protein [Acinetobacter wanghuae]QGA11018.1 hypothetical protein GFH30_06265 [Acinetobacter wanghuae]
MDIQKELNAFKEVAQSKGWNTDGETTPTNFRFYCLTTHSGWEMWQAAKANAVPKGFVLVEKRNMIGNPNVDWLQAPRWAKYWLKDGHSNKYWWSSIRPVKDMDICAFCWKGDYFAEEAPSFDFTGSWDKSLTSKKAMIEAREPSHD